MAKHKSGRARKPRNSITPPPLQFNCPAISVIIPMYNAEKYVGECLDSILAQTFQNFEVIVVDDCSTDNSIKIVESYAPKFGGRLKLTKTKKNSGGPGRPRNKGLTLSRGEYISFLDADDTISPTAFSEFYTVAKKFDADVVACEKFYNIPEKFWNDAEFRKQLKPFSYQQGDFVSEPTLLTDNILERVQRYHRGGYLWNLWSKLIRRNFILDNEIAFSESNIIDDFIFTGCLACTAERFLMVPNVVNYYREMEGSISHTKDKGSAYFLKYLKALLTAFRDFDKFLSSKEFFQRHPDAKYLALEKVWLEISNYLIKIYGQIPAPVLDEILRKEFSDGDNTALTAFIFNLSNIYRLQLMQAYQKIAALENELHRVK